MPDSQRRPWDLNLINNLEDTVVFQALNGFNSLKLFIVLEAKKSASHFCGETTNKKTCFHKQKHGYLKLYLIRNAALSMEIEITFKVASK